MLYEINSNLFVESQYLRVHLIRMYELIYLKKESYRMMKVNSPFFFVLTKYRYGYFQVNRTFGGKN